MKFDKPRIHYKAIPGHLESDRHSYHIEEWDGQQLLRTFTAFITATQKASHPQSDIERWCELYSDKLPTDGSSIEIDLNNIQIL